MTTQIDPQRSASPRAERTVLFSDVVASTEMIEARGDEHWFRLIESHSRAIQGIAKGYGGRVASFAGDGFMIAFDNVGDGVMCALRLQFAFAVQDELSIRLGVEHGPVIPFGDDGYVGLTVHLAARYTAMCAAGELKMSEACYQAARVTVAVPELPQQSVEIRGVHGPRLVRVSEASVGRRLW